LYYVKKCSGKYENNIAAARYVHQMSEEVMSLLSGLALEVKRSKGEPEAYQKLLDEWNEAFPSTLGKYGSPKIIALKVANQDKELADLRNALSSERESKEKDITEILNSVDSQLASYKINVMNERKQQQLFSQDMKDNYEKKLEETINNFEKKIQILDANNTKLVETLKSNHNKQINLLKNEKINLEKNINTLKQNYENKISKITLDTNNTILELNKKYESLKDLYNDLKLKLNDEYSIVSLDEENFLDTKK
jgi:hypothetical protein